jgi:redox-sensitive bicupin YhaK (pirin superfamily)
MFLQIRGREKDLGGGFRVSRLLPSVACRAVGPFVFLDHFGPMKFQPGMNIDVRPHPHIGLATVTYLFDGAIMHRDSLGSVQRIEPGAINWMSAGRGIVHSERTPDDLRQRVFGVHGLQLWVALPRDREEDEPSFRHAAAALLPSFTDKGLEVRVLVGTAFGHTSPVKTASETLFVAMRMAAGAEVNLPSIAPELAVVAIGGDILIDGERMERSTLAVLERERPVRLRAIDGGDVVVIGGAALDGPRFLWWNFVSSRKERISKAAEDWANHRMGEVPGEADEIPLPASGRGGAGEGVS